MPFQSGIPHPILNALARIEPDAKFVSHGSTHVQSLSSNQSYYVKMGRERDIEQYFGEAESLRVMATACPGICPHIFECFVDEEATKRPVFISEYKSLGPLNKRSAVELGSLLAEMHEKGRNPTGQFGFAIPTYCGASRMRNGWENTWEKTFDKMMGDLLKCLEDVGEFEELCRKGNQIRHKYAFGLTLSVFYGYDK
ncbi:hypothetical protein Clacol_003976 [Clathrus columnatus]|uniref:protein-ribulosamine 3-kinase n=1 Tax=Clathrus columnatus TaxID=1419009 RepID=A0AAV5A5A1_9AGAM|nr:hypothetical protein Clacol_003976 [Clathrus columnatus]